MFFLGWRSVSVRNFESFDRVRVRRTQKYMQVTRQSSLPTPTPTPTPFRTRTRTRSLTLTRQQSIDRRPRSRAARATQAQKSQLHNCQAVECVNYRIHRLATVATAIASSGGSYNHRIHRLATVATVWRRWPGLSSSLPALTGDRLPSLP